MSSALKLHFYGAAGCVTGSRHVLTTPQARVLIDCGQFQGIKSLRQRNRAPFPIDPQSLDAVFITHGHLDHCGWLPVLMRQGFKGPIYCSAPTQAVAELILRDSGKIQQEEAQRANEAGWSAHKPARPLFTLAEAEQCLQQFVPVETGVWLDLLPGLKVRWRRISHILGACFIEIESEGQRLVFSGDVGRSDDLLLPDPEKPEKADILVMESTYGDRLHQHTPLVGQLYRQISKTLERKGSVLIPGFSVERMQTLLWLLHQLEQSKQLPKVPVLFDSPLGQQMLALFARFPDWHQLSLQTLDALTHKVRVVESVQDSLSWAANPTPKIVIAGSGMLSGGRILNYLRHELPNPRSSILLSGYQASGTRGRLLQDGARELRLEGKYLPVKAQVKMLQGLSSHADQAGLLDWLSELKTAPEHVFLVHGEHQAADALRVKLNDSKGWSVSIPQFHEVYKLSPAKECAATSASL